MWPLFPLQEGLLFHALYDGSSADVYTAQFVLALDGPLDAGLLRACAGALLARHPGLRAGFQQVGDGTAAQVIWREVPLRWREVDLSGVPEAGQGGAVRDVLDGERVAGFDMARPPLVRFVLVRLGGESAPAGGHQSSHRVGRLVGAGADRGAGGSLPGRGTGDGAAAGGAGAAVPGLAGLVGPGGGGGGLGGCPGRPAGADAGRAAGGRAHGGHPRVGAPGAAAGAHGGAGRGGPPRGVTLNTLVQAAWALYLSRVTGQHDVVFGATVSGRPAGVPDVERMVGLFINTVPVRVRVREDETLAGLLARVQAEQAELLPHHYLPLPRIQHAAGHGALFDTLTVFENYPVADDGGR